MEPLYNAVQLLSTAISITLDSNMDVSNGELVAMATHNSTFPGYHGLSRTTLHGDVMSYFSILDFDPLVSQFIPVLEVLSDTDLVIANDMSSIQWPRGTVLPQDTCDFELCKGAGE